GRFPIRVELEALGKGDFVRILTEPKSALIKQYMALLSTEGLTIRFTEGAVGRIADFATLVNERTENIGARRLHTVMEKLLDEVSFEASDLSNKEITIDDAYVDRMLADIAVAAVTFACGRKGPPLAPLHLVPTAPANLSVARVGAEAQLRFDVPSKNQNGPGTVAIDRIEVFAATVAAGALRPANRELLTTKYRIATISIKPPPVEGETPPESTTDT